MSQPQSALLCTVMELGAVRILFAVDWPFNSNIEGVEFVRTAPIKPLDKSKIFAGNAADLLRSWDWGTFDSLVAHVLSPRSAPGHNLNSERHVESALPRMSGH